MSKPKTKPIKLPETQRLTDLCECINAYEGYCMSVSHDRPANQGDEAVDAFLERKRKRESTQERQHDMLYALMIAEACKLLESGFTLKYLDEAIRVAGWEDQHFVVQPNGKLEIVND